MNEREVATVLGIFHAAFPAAQITEQTPMVWASKLAGIDLRDGMAAADSLIGTAKFFPSLAEFLESVRSEVRIRTGNTEGRTPQNTRTDPAVAELDESTSYSREEIEENRAGVSRHVRAVLAAQRGRQHDHRGPNPCSVCGGMRSA